MSVRVKLRDAQIFCANQLKSNQNIVKIGNIDGVGQIRQMRPPQRSKYRGKVAAHVGRAVSASAPRKRTIKYDTYIHE